MINLIETIANIGKNHPYDPTISEIIPFQKYFCKPNDRELIKEHFKTSENNITVRELILRYLLLSVVLDQGPDIVGLRKLVTKVTNTLYSHNIRFLHNPIIFFKELSFISDCILEIHENIKNERADLWAKDNKSNPNRYNLFLDNSKQILNYIIFRWGVPISLPIVLSKYNVQNENQAEPLFSFLKEHSSSENMCADLKSNYKYGLGKAIGNKACHLFAKWTLSIHPILKSDEPSWGDLSYETPFDSNAGRVLWRSGFFLMLADEIIYRKNLVIQPDVGKFKKNYIRVTNSRGIKTDKNNLPPKVWEKYIEISMKYLCTHKKRKPIKAEIQRVPNAVLLDNTENLGIADFDNGLIYIGTNYCYNHNSPDCENCPIGSLCRGNLDNPELILNYHT